MQLVKLSNKLRPITIAASLLTVGSIPYAYSDIDSHSGILSVTSNNTTTNYLNSVDKNDSSFFLHKFRFQSHLLNWENKTKFLSSAKSIIEDKDFQAIISMGNPAIPYIVEEIESKPSVLVWSLNIILDRKITNNPNATITDACKLWVKELKK